MIRLTKYQMLLLFFFLPALFAADKPAWTIDYKKFNLPKQEKPVEIGKESEYDQVYKIQFTPDNKVLISFWERRPQTGLAKKDAPENSGTIFVVLLLSSETGELLKRIELPVMGETLWVHRFQYGSRIYPLSSGGYVGIINRHLQVFDSSFNVIHDKILEKPKDVHYTLIAPLHGQFFSLEFWSDERITEIIDTKTFKTVERFSGDNIITDIWEDQLIVGRYPKYPEAPRFFEKKIGASQWNDLGQAITTSAKAKFIYNGAIVITDAIEQKPYTKFWFKIENGKKSDPITGFIEISKPSRNTPTIALEINFLSEFQRSLDMDGKYRIETYDLNTQKTLLATKKYTYIVDYAISPNGDSVALIIKNKKIELYNVKPQNDKKK